MEKSERFLVLGLLLILASACSAVNTGIEISVKVKEDVPNHLCARFFNNLESLFNATSLLLERESSVTVSSIRVELPASMVTSDQCVPSNVTVARVWEADTSTQPASVVVTPRDPVFGSSPYSVQHGGCGERGARVTLPADSLVQADTVAEDTVTALASSLVSHVYGVFPTHGYPEDPRYPASYSLAGVVLDNSDCRGHGALFCSPHSYLHTAPTKQNLLCGGVSPREMVRQATSNSAPAPAAPPSDTPAPPPPPPPRVVRYVSHVATRYVLVLDRSASMAAAGRWSNLHNALFGFITELAEGDELAIVTFAAEARTNLEPTPVTPANKEGLHGRVPGRATPRNSSCLSCGLSAALGLASADPGVVTVVIAVRGDGSAGEPEAAAVERKLAARNVPIYGLVLGEEFVNHKEKTENKFWVVSDGSDQQAQLSDVLLAVRNDVTHADGGYAKFYENKLRTDGGGNIEGKFSVEESLRTDLKVILTTHTKEDIEKFELVSPSGEQHRFPFVERGSVYFQFRGEAEPGIWSYSVTRQAAAPARSTLSSYARRTGPSTVQLRAWTSRQVASPEQAVVLYAELSAGAAPVSGARVEAEVRTPGGGTRHVLLVDTGTGYPDTTAGDGIYSAYFTQYSDKPGGYSLTVSASDSGAAARVPSYGVTEATADCCGSRYPALTTIPAPPFTRRATAPSFYLGRGAHYLIHQGEPRARDVFAPVRVTDLRVTRTANTSLGAQLTWSAPGDNLDEGAAALYQLKCATDRAALVTSFANLSSAARVEVPRPGRAGSEETARVELPSGNTLYHCGLVAEDAAGNQSPVSNLATVFVRQLVPEPGPGQAGDWVDTGSLLQRDQELEGGLDNMLIYIITGGGVIIVIILVFVIICITHKPRKEQKTKAPMITEISAPTLIHSSSAVLPGILKQDPASSQLSVLPHTTSVPSNDYSMDYGGSKGAQGDLSWAILPSYSNVAFKKSSETIVDSGFYRAGEAVDNVYEFYQPSAEYAIYQQVNKEKKFEDTSDNGTATTDCEISDTTSDKMLRHFQQQHGQGSPSGHSGKGLPPGTSGDFHSLIVTTEDFKKAVSELEREQHSGPVSLPHYTNFEDFAERRRRRESFV